MIRCDGCGKQGTDPGERDYSKSAALRERPIHTTFHNNVTLYRQLFECRFCRARRTRYARKEGLTTEQADFRAALESPITTPSAIRTAKRKKADQRRRERQGRFGGEVTVTDSDLRSAQLDEILLTIRK